MAYKQRDNIYELIWTLFIQPGVKIILDKKIKA